MDNSIRIAAFKWLEEQTRINGEVLSRKLLENGFIFKEEKITLLGAKGIWKPRAMSFPLSITTISNGPYSDTFTNEGFLRYKYRGDNPAHSDNRGLREMIKLRIPLIYFHSIVKGKYIATWPVYIIEDNMRDLVFTVAIDDIKLAWERNEVNADAAYYRRSYLTSNVLLRVHQKSFRERVLAAYRNQCALCRLKHIELLDAAHIISDKEDSGDPVVQNGMALCKIHHAAFDSNFIGVTPDFKIKVRSDLLEEHDGPMLKYGIQELNDKKIILPANPNFWSDKERLEIRYSRFLISTPGHLPAQL